MIVAYFPSNITDYSQIATGNTYVSFTISRWENWFSNILCTLHSIYNWHSGFFFCKLRLFYWQAWPDFLLSHAHDKEVEDISHPKSQWMQSVSEVAFEMFSLLPPFWVSRAPESKISKTLFCLGWLWHDISLTLECTFL